MSITVKEEQLPQYFGYELETTPWHRVTQEQIDQFADCTLDHQYIHVDPLKAKETMFGSTIAHGFLTLSMLSYFSKSYSIIIEGLKMSVNSGFDKVRFIQPVLVGSNIRAHAKIIDIEEKKQGQYRIKTSVTIEIEGVEKPAMIAEWICIQMVS